jgi:hypothetical protein
MDGLSCYFFCVGFLLSGQAGLCLFLSVSPPQSRHWNMLVINFTSLISA